MAGVPENSPLSSRLKCQPTTMALMGRLLSLMGRFLTLTGRFHEFVLMGRFPS